ncbi:hypothetical protein, partial [Flavobacterium tegetincola]|uniref:hypothetical protein n=1 Tax=Flavobacterium tegetincola TaxID=150172 RepID=UPI001B7FC129
VIARNEAISFQFYGANRLRCHCEERSNLIPYSRHPSIPSQKTGFPPVWAILATLSILGVVRRASKKVQQNSHLLTLKYSQKNYGHSFCKKMQKTRTGKGLVPVIFFSYVT